MSTARASRSWRRWSVAILSCTLSLASHASSAIPTQVELGAYYFGANLLSKDGRQSCSSCHLPQTAWQDGYERALSRRLVMIRNTPTLYNVLRYRSFFWDGRAKSLEEQIAGPLFDRLELAASEKTLLEATKACPAAEEAWRISNLTIRDFVVNALATYLRAIPKGSVRFEQHLLGRATLDETESEGLRLFKNVFRCAACHQLPALTDNQFHDIKLPRRRIVFQTFVDPLDNYGAAEVRVMLGLDYGRLNVSNKKEDVHAFRTPSLYHVSKTEPYMHDGTFRSLFEVLDFYSRKRIEHGQLPMTEPQKRALMSLFGSFSDFTPETLPTPACSFRP